MIVSFRIRSVIIVVAVLRVKMTTAVIIIMMSVVFPDTRGRISVSGQLTKTNCPSCENL